jgi:multidrug resistance efflux pump
MASLYVHGRFRENLIGRVDAGNRAIVTLMTYPDRPLEGRVDSIGRGISSSAHRPSPGAAGVGGEN